MTGFARAAREAEWGRWAWEAKSVNGRGLDVRVALPPGFEAVEAAAKREAKARFTRGSLQLSLRLDLAADDEAAEIDDVLLDRLCEAWMRRTGSERVSGEAVAALLAVRGVVEPRSVSTRDLADKDEVQAAVLSALTEALDALARSRRQEGETLAGVFTDLLDRLEAGRSAAEGAAADQPVQVKTRLERRLAELGAEASVDAERLAAEAALAAAKADVREELDRLRAHIETGRAHLAEGGAKGRQLDFLAQELNREANTLCSKSASLDLTNAGLGLKALIDQFKEQAANVE